MTEVGDVEASSWVSGLIAASASPCGMESGDPKRSSGMEPPNPKSLFSEAEANSFLSGKQYRGKIQLLAR